MALPLLLLAGYAGSARADKLTELTRALIEDDSYKVRVQAALVLGKLKDKRAGPALVKALKDDNATVRAVAARSLGMLGDKRAGRALRAASTTDESQFVRREAQLALKKLQPAKGVSPGSAKFYLVVGPLAGNSRKIKKGAINVFRTALIKELEKTPRVTLEASAAKGKKGFWVDGNIVRLKTQPQGSFTEVTCDVKILLATYPAKSIIMWTDGGATVQTSNSDSAVKTARRDCLEAAVQSVQQNVATFLKAQGG